VTLVEIEWSGSFDEELGFGFMDGDEIAHRCN
jgi:hypothetical protein